LPLPRASATGPHCNKTTTDTKHNTTVTVHLPNKRHTHKVLIPASSNTALIQNGQSMAGATTHHNDHNDHNHQGGWGLAG